MSVTKRVDSNLFQFLMAHVDEHIPGDLGNKLKHNDNQKQKQMRPTPIVRGIF